MLEQAGGKKSKHYAESRHHKFASKSIRDVQRQRQPADLKSNQGYAATESLTDRENDAENEGSDWDASITVRPLLHRAHGIEAHSCGNTLHTGLPISASCPSHWAQSERVCERQIQVSLIGTVRAQRVGQSVPGVSAHLWRGLQG